MFFPFLPLILASVSLTLLSGEAERPEIWWNLHPGITLFGVLLFSFVPAQLPRQLWPQFVRKRFAVSEKADFSSAQLTLPRLLILSVWLSVVYGEHLDLRLKNLLANYSESEPYAESLSWGVLLLICWLADAFAAIPVLRWSVRGVFEKLRKSIQHLRLQLPVLVLSFIQGVWFWGMTQILPSSSSDGIFFFEMLSGLILMMLLAPPVLVKSWGAYFLKSGEKYEVIRKELEAFRTPVAGILAWPEAVLPHTTAGVIGIVRGFRYLLISPKLLDALSPQELRAVIAHEAGHIRRKHLLFYVVAFFCFLELLTFGGTANFLLEWAGVWEVSGMLVSIAALLSVLLFLRFGIGFLSQNFERQADCHALERAGVPPIAGALLKVAWLNGIDPNQENWHHYGIRERIDFLLSCQKKPEKLQKHHQRVFRIKTVCALLLVGILGANAMLTSKVVQTEVLAWKLEQYHETWEQKDAPLLTQMGDLLYFQNRSDSAELWYRRSLELNPGDAHTLNNLAWLLAEEHGNDEKRLRESVILANKALEQKQAAFIWDTLAEAYRQNGEYEAAVNAAHQALTYAQAGNGLTRATKLDYYRERLEKMTGLPSQM